MRVASKIATGSGVLLVLLVLALAYQVSQIRRLSDINHQVSQVNFRVAALSIEQTKLFNKLDEFTRKFFVTRDAAYAERLNEIQLAVATHLGEAQSLKLSTSERLELERLQEIWQRYAGIPLTPIEIPAVGDAPSVGEAQLNESRWRQRETALTTLLSELQQQTSRLTESTQIAIRRQVDTSQNAAERSARISWVFAIAALLISVPVLILTVHSIRQPLQRLTQGTRAVADGEFSLQIKAGRHDEFEQLADSFNAMVRRLSELDQMKKDFLSQISHELKTPLVAMLETNQLLLEGIPGPLSEQQRRMLMLNQQGCARLSAMIARLLDLARMEEGAFEYEFKQRDLRTLLTTVADEFEAKARERRIEVEVVASPHPRPAVCDGNRLTQVIENLVENALKYSPPGGQICLDLVDMSSLDPDTEPQWPAPAKSLQRTASVLITVSDNGPGIPDEEKERVFEKFHQIRRPRRPESSGVGLGLAICREILDAHQGVIWAGDNGNQGAVLYCLLPTNGPHEAEAA